MNNESTPITEIPVKPYKEYTLKEKLIVSSFSLLAIIVYTKE